MGKVKILVVGLLVILISLNVFAFTQVKVVTPTHSPWSGVVCYGGGRRGFVDFNLMSTDYNTYDFVVDINYSDVNYCGNPDGNVIFEDLNLVTFDGNFVYDEVDGNNLYPGRDFNHVWDPVDMVDYNGYLIVNVKNPAADVNFCVTSDWNFGIDSIPPEVYWDGNKDTWFYGGFVPTIILYATDEGCGMNWLYGIRVGFDTDPSDDTNYLDYGVDLNFAWVFLVGYDNWYYGIDLNIDGNTGIRVYARDWAGNRSDVNEFFYLQDTNAPIILPDLDVNTTQDHFNWSFDLNVADENAGDLYCDWNGFEDATLLAGFTNQTTQAIAGFCDINFVYEPTSSTIYVVALARDGSGLKSGTVRSNFSTYVAAPSGGPGGGGGGGLPPEEEEPTVVEQAVEAVEANPALLLAAAFVAFVVWANLGKKVRVKGYKARKKSYTRNYKRSKPKR